MSSVKILRNLVKRLTRYTQIKWYTFFRSILYLVLIVKFSAILAAHEASEQLIRNSSSKCHQKKFRHPTLSSKLMTGNQFKQRMIVHLKELNSSYLLFECHLDRMPSRFSMIFLPNSTSTFPISLHRNCKLHRFCQRRFYCTILLECV